MGPSTSTDAAGVWQPTEGLPPDGRDERREGMLTAALWAQPPLGVWLTIGLAAAVGRPEWLPLPGLWVVLACGPLAAAGVAWVLWRLWGTAVALVVLAAPWIVVAVAFVGALAVGVVTGWT